MTQPPAARWHPLLRHAFAAAHRALKRLEDDQVPASLRPVRAASVRRTLPRPLERILVEHLEEGWLRELALVELGDGDSPPARAAHLYLSRPEGWEQAIESIAEARQERSQAHETQAMQAENERLQRLAEQLTERLRQAEAQVTALSDELTSDERAEALRRRLDEALRAQRRMEAALAENEAELERVRSELAEADDRVSVLRNRNLRSAPPSPGASGSGDRAFGRGRPIETARLLDELVETMRPSREKEREVVPPDPLRFPSGLRPDAPEAIEWIRSVDRPLLVVVDGHNVAHDLDPRPGRTARDRVVSEVARLRRLAEGPLAAIVFFDTVHAAERHTNAGVSVRYVDDADSAIEAIAAGTDIACVVISTDREVRARASAHGAIALWGSALSAWIQRR
ncbi:MAG TPA: hypothetical protein VLB67_14460 [Acidimicrobiia bacterium]|nr:hypothetical protein [Acidimicrobiia bacterium]